MSVIQCNDISVSFKRSKTRDQNTKPFELAWWLTSKETFWALDSVSFNIEEGQVLGVIGGNGAGKTTLLKILTGVLEPDKGSIQVNGRISALLGLGAGFVTDLSGRDNIFLNGMYLNMKESEVRKKLNDIISFAEIQDFIDTPVRHYSSGMKARLGFSIAVHVNPEILVIDEVLATGDRSFQKKARQKMDEMMCTAKAIVIVSHNTSFVKEFCNKAIYLRNGKIIKRGNVDKVVDYYENYMDKKGDGN